MLPFAPAALHRRLLRGLRSCAPAKFRGWLTRFPAPQRRRLGALAVRCSTDLLDFGRRSDQAFTALAQGLGEVNQTLHQLRQQNTEFLSIMEDRDADRSIASAQEIYQHSVDLVHASIGIAASEQAQMQGIETALLAACAARAQFKRNQLLLNIITMSIRMEASRMEPENQSIFLNVGDAIGDINRRISSSTEVAFQRIETVIRETVIERVQLQSIEHDLHARAQTSIRTIQRELGSLQAALRPCAEQSRRISEQFAATEPLLLGTLVSLQHQDIVRQQLEHVSAGFHDLQAHLGLADLGTRPLPLDPGYIHHAASVQQAHLHSARGDITQASRAVVTGLETMLAASTTLVESFSAMEAAGSAAFADFRIVDMFREEIGQLARIADKSKDTNGNISRLVQRIEEVVRVFAGEVGHHELDVKIVALNAQIASARVPSADALSRLAEETSHVSHQNTDVTRQLLGNLQSSLTQLLAIKASADEFLAIVTGEKTELEKGVAEVTAKLTRLSTRVQTEVTRVRHDYEAVHTRAQRLLQQVALEPLIAQTFPPAEQLCVELLTATAASAHPDALSAQAVARLEAHRDRYTMHQENTTHTAAITPGLRQAAPPPPANPAALGDGIELF